MRRWLVALAVVLASVAAILPSSGHADQAVFPGSTDLTLGPLISGTSSYVDGTYVWTDYAYDDRGPAGNATYPSSISGGNAADLIQLQLALTPEGDLKIRAILETLTRPEVPLLGVGFDTDGNAATGAQTIPGGRWTPQNRLGLEVFVTASLEGGSLIRANADAWSEAARFAAVVDPESNSITTVVPRSVLDPGTATWRAVGVLGLALAGNSWVEGTGHIYDLAFLVAEAPGFFGGLTWQDVHQRNVLTGSVSEGFGIRSIDFSRMALGHTQLATLTPGFHTLLYYSHLNLGQGIRPFATTGFESLRSTDAVYAGPYQPYVVHVPEGSTGPLPAIVWLHGREGNHVQGAQLSFAGFRPQAFLIFPLGRGPNVGFGGTDIFGFVNDINVYGEQDVLDVLADATRRLPIDPDRVLMSGFSMGAVGAFHLAEFYPDRFTGLLSLGGGDFGIIPFNHLRPRLLGNLTNLPGRAANGAVDPLANYPAWEEATLTLDLMGDIDYRAYLAARRAHEVYDPLVRCVYLDLIGRPRVVDPPRVAYTVNPAFEIDDASKGLSVRHTGSYWVTGLKLRDAGARNLTFEEQEFDQSANATIDVTTLARADRAPQHTPVASVSQNFTSGADFCGPNPAIRTNDAWRVRGMQRTEGPPQPTSNGIHLEMSNFSHAALDLTRMSLAVTEPITMTVTGDGTSTVTLLGPWRPGTRVTVEKRPAGALGLVQPPKTRTLVAQEGALLLTDDFSGSNDYVLTPATGPLGAIIDVRPGDDENVINPRSQGTIPVAVLSAEGFDAATADPESLTFGPTGDEPSLARHPSGSPRCSQEDANEDGTADLLCHFHTEAAGFQEGDEIAILRGQTTSGEGFEGTDAIRVVGSPSTEPDATDTESQGSSQSADPIDLSADLGGAFGLP